MLLTGHTGFKGAWLSFWFARLGAEVTGYSLDPPSEPNLYDLASVAECCRAVHGDVRDRELLGRTVRECRPDVVVHLAAQALVGEGYRLPVETFEVNAQGTANLLDALRNVEDEPAVIIVTSDKCYEPRTDGSAHVETDRLGGHDPYSASKACAEQITAAWRASFYESSGPRVATVRAGNVLGGGDFGHGRIVTDAVTALRRKQPLTLRRPQAVRPWQYVLDLLAGYMLLAERLTNGGREYATAWNFGSPPEQARTVAGLVESFGTHYGEQLRVEVEAPPFEENPLLALDSTQARTRLGWRPLLDTEGAIRETARWYRAWADGDDPARLTAEAILRHERLWEAMP